MTATLIGSALAVGLLLGACAGAWWHGRIVQRGLDDWQDYYRKGGQW